ncbi:GNAT family N-acetyltransferase [Streptomyces sp. NBC_00076]|uniref:GNAT family N-acetyltransferase n=1 Tax=Streptomyces sp. NBC_00076 TaxID=2975642 RepID=UPI00324AC220
MRDMGGERVEEAVASSVALLRTATDRAWEGVRAGGLEWSCRRTVEHLAEALLKYASQLAGRAAEHRVPLVFALADGTDDEGVLDVLRTTGSLLIAALRTTPREVRAFHPFPFLSANREGFAAMGVAEVLLHTHDIAEGLGLPYEPPAGLAEYVLTGIFPHVRPGPDLWRTLLWATGRGELPGRARLTEWHWSNNLVLATDRLTLEGVTPAAAADLRAGGDGGFEWLDGGPYEGTREASEWMMKAYEGGIHRPEFGLFVLVRRSDGRAVGGLGFHSAPDEEGRAEIGYDLVPGARGNGYVTEALRALSQWALARADVRSLFATVERGNTPSQAVLSRVGFRQVSEDLDDEGLLAYELRD